MSGCRKMSSEFGIEVSQQEIDSTLREIEDGCNVASFLRIVGEPKDLEDTHKRQQLHC